MRLEIFFSLSFFFLVSFFSRARREVFSLDVKGIYLD